VLKNCFGIHQKLDLHNICTFITSSIRARPRVALIAFLLSPSNQESVICLEDDHAREARLINKLALVSVLSVDSKIGCYKGMKDFRRVAL
jgi:hypothetical protein